MLALVGCDARGGGSSSKRIILLTNGADPFWDAMRAGMQDAEKDFQLADVGLQTVMDVNDGTPKGQVDRLRQYANQSDIAAVAVSVTDSKNVAIANAMKACRDGRHPGDRHRFRRRSQMPTATRASPTWAPTTWWAVRNWAKRPRGIRPAGGKYATFVGLKGAANAIERIDGFATGAGEKFKQLENLGDDMDLSVALKNVKDALDRNPELDVLVGIWAYNAHAIVEVVDQRNLQRSRRRWWSSTRRPRPWPT